MTTYDCEKQARIGLLRAVNRAQDLIRSGRVEAASRHLERAKHTAEAWLAGTHPKLLG